MAATDMRLTPFQRRREALGNTEAAASAHLVYAAAIRAHDKPTSERMRASGMCLLAYAAHLNTLYTVQAVAAPSANDSTCAQ